MRGADEAKRQFGVQLRGLPNRNRLEEPLAILRFFERVQGQRRIMLRHFSLVVERRVFFLQVSGVRQHD